MSVFPLFALRLFSVVRQILDFHRIRLDNRGTCFHLYLVIYTSVLDFAMFCGDIVTKMFFVEDCVEQTKSTSKNYQIGQDLERTRDGIIIKENGMNVWFQYLTPHSSQQQEHPTDLLPKHDNDDDDDDDDTISIDMRTKSLQNDLFVCLSGGSFSPLSQQTAKYEKNVSVIKIEFELSLCLKNIKDTSKDVNSIGFLSKKSSLDYLFSFRDSFIPRDIQVNYLEVVSHPTEINGIPWNFLNREYYRLVSFVKYPTDSSVSTIRLASKGFAYPGDGNDFSVICCFCTILFQELRELENIDEEHKRLRENCPMVEGSKCNNITMKEHSPEDAERFFTHFQEGRQNMKGGANALAGNESSLQTAARAQNNLRSSQPSDESAASAIVTNTTDLAEGGEPGQNTVSGENMQSSQIMDDEPVAQDQREAVLVPTQASTTSTTATATSNSQNTETASTPSSQQNNSEQNNTQQSSENTSSNENSGEATNYEKLGIITARPKRPEYAVYQTRFNSFNEWPKKHHMKPKDLANAGYFYTGYSDCARCFYCGGGLRNWEPEDDVWVEHARWFPKCAYLLQEVGSDFINTVQAMSKERDEIKYDDVIRKMQGTNTPSPLTFKEKGVERDPAVQTVVDYGFTKDDICKLAVAIRKNGEILTSEKLYEAAKVKSLVVNVDNNLQSDSVSIRRGGNEERDKETIETLRNDNGELRQQTICKICMDMEVSVVFLPCGHFVSCTECSCALTSCPVCRVGIKGIVRAYMG